jgi:hypothetical protein
MAARERRRKTFAAARVAQWRKHSKQDAGDAEPKCD